jgi:hypothetical protein
MIATALAATLLGQTIPSSASVLYPCFPESPSETQVRLVTHSATYNLDKTSVRCSTQSVFKNLSAKPVTLNLRLPVRGKQVNWAQSEGLRFSAMVGKAAVSLNAGAIQRTDPTAQQKANGIWAGTFEKAYTVTLSFKAGETKSVSSTFSAPIGRAGLDGAQRMVVYDTAGADNWNGEVQQFNYAIQYKPSLVLQVYAALPEGNWQIGSSGAFWKKYDFAPPQKPLLIFTYYPGGFDEIGGSTGG